jgi:hypothetical protein
MKASITVHGFLKHSVPEKYRSGTVEVDLKGATSIYELLKHDLFIDAPNTTVLINGVIKNRDYCVQDSDIIQIISPIPDG